MKYTCINIQGNLISEEILQKIEQAEAQGQLATDFGLEPGSNIRSEIEYAWSRIKLDWKHFNDKSQNLPASDPYGTTLSRKWMEQFLSSLGFDLSRSKSGLLGDNNHSYTISHTAENLDHLPIHIVGFSEPSHPDKNTLDIKTSGGTSKFSPHGTMQEYLNVTENIYGIASNGLFLRLIRDSGRLIKLTYVEFDIKRMMDEDKYSEFTLLYRSLHASRFPRNKAEADQCLLEKYYQDSIETGNRIRDGLSLAVKESLVALGKGFLQNENNTALREKIQAGTLSSKDYYRQLLRIIYRFLFLMVTEERDLVYDPEDKSETTQTLKKYYLLYYSIARLRKLSESHYVYEAQFNDLWQGLVNTFLLFEGGSNGKKLGIQPLNGDLFSFSAIADLQGSLINNRLLLECVKNLNEFKDENKNLVAINYRSLDVEELGSVYEGLLELHPVIENIEANNPAHINFTFHEGTDRKTTGSYYTRPELVNELIKSALIPVIEERLKEHTGNTTAQAKALLKLKVCDAAAGSGHMLLAAARTIAWYLARVQSGEENPAPSVYRKCLREVIQHCIYAVDYNPDAVELCKLALWLEGHNSGKPLSFLDHKIRNGNSLVGITNLNALQKGIPDDAFNPVTGDDKKICQELKKENAKYNKTKQVTLDFEQSGNIDTSAFTGDYKELEKIQQDDVEGVKQVKTKFEKFRNNHTWFKDWRACNLWTAAFFWNYTEENKQAAPNSERLAKFLNNPAAAYGPMIGKSDALSTEHKFFHWPLEFPDVFEQGGFDVMLGNPPWERIKLQEKEFFKNKDGNVSTSKTKDIRKASISSLEENNPALFQDFIKNKISAEKQSLFINSSRNYSLANKGDLNTYALFTELNLQLINKSNGRIGIVIPSGIATDSPLKEFFEYLVLNNKIISLFDFENRKGKYFATLHTKTKYCLFTAGHNFTGDSMFGFYLNFVEEIKDKTRVFYLSKADFLLLNPNTKTCPIFKNTTDAKIVKDIYKRVPIFYKEGVKNEWDFTITEMIHMSSDSDKFLMANKIDGKDAVPLVEGKMIFLYNSRYSNASFSEDEEAIRGTNDALSIEELKDPFSVGMPRFYIENKYFPEKFANCKYFLVTRKVSDVMNERTFIVSIVNRAFVGNSLQTFAFTNAIDHVLFQANASALIFDYVLRQKLGGKNIAQFIINQLPIYSRADYQKQNLLKIIPSVLELDYNYWKIKDFADDVWKEADDDLKAAITKQWEENKEVTGGHEWAPPEWCAIDETGCPLPPFKWDESRRALLKAELDAIYAKLYGLTTEELRYILDPQDVYGGDFQGETFRVLKEKETRLYGEYRTKRLVSEAWDKMNNS
jgi:hypothetical protein